MSTPLPLHARIAAPAFPRGFFATHLVLPLVLALAAGALLMRAGGDQWLADALFRLEGGRWVLREHWLTASLVHRGGKWASVLAALAMLAVLLRATRQAALHHLRRPLLYLALATLLGSGSVSLLKSATAVDCPWDLARYGGTRLPLDLLAPHPPGVPRGACFPAGHASAGYAWVALYFAALLGRPAWRWRGLLAGLGTGLLFGAAQQLRGAHFLSHDIAALAVCWTLSLAAYCMFVLDGRRQAAAATRAVEATA